MKLNISKYILKTIILTYSIKARVIVLAKKYKLNKVSNFSN